MRSREEVLEEVQKMRTELVRAVSCADYCGASRADERTKTLNWILETNEEKPIDNGDTVGTTCDSTRGTAADNPGIGCTQEGHCYPCCEYFCKGSEADSNGNEEHGSSPARNN